MEDVPQMARSSVIESMTAAELSMAERKAGLAITSLEDVNAPKVDMLAALGWVYRRRSDSSMTFEQYRERHTIQQITEELGIADDDGADELPGGKASSSSKPKGKRNSASRSQSPPASTTS